MRRLQPGISKAIAKRTILALDDPHDLGVRDDLGRAGKEERTVHDIPLFQGLVRLDEHARCTYVLRGAEKRFIVEFAVDLGLEEHPVAFSFGDIKQLADTLYKLQRPDGLCDMHIRLASC